MIRVDFDPSQLTGEQRAWWAVWEQRAAMATREIIQKWEASETISSEADFDPRIWGELKVWLLRHFFNYKCAYCETDVRRQRQEMEHYRPKAGVNYREAGKRTLTLPEVEWLPGQRIKHPGYFWLAYHWKNLLPCCGPCNSGAGKKNQFPVADPAVRPHLLLHPLTPGQLPAYLQPPAECGKRPGHYYLDPDGLDAREEPLLLNPYVHDPRQHLRFGDKGIEAARQDSGSRPSPLGVNSIEVYDLKSEGLRGLRAEAQGNAETMLLLAFMAAKTQQPQAARTQWLDDAYRTTVNSLTSANGVYLAAALDWIDQVHQDPGLLFLGARVPVPNHPSP
ncbi:MAG TPA: hypothetical protein VH092_27080 [Urbifossiella sp.]|jgi:hypothetical protein|nr:hypothetical protein [Urbifossiella sp.]